MGIDLFGEDAQETGAFMTETLEGLERGALVISRGLGIIAYYERGELIISIAVTTLIVHGIICHARRRHQKRKAKASARLKDTGGYDNVYY